MIMDPEYQKKLREIEQWEKEREELAKREQPYNAWQMNAERMPWGCWAWIALAVGIALWILKKYWLGI